MKAGGNWARWFLKSKGMGVDSKRCAMRMAVHSKEGLKPGPWQCPGRIMLLEQLL